MRKMEEPELDEHGYPTEQTLETIRLWDETDYTGLIDYLESAWKYPTYFDKRDGYAYVSTGGWSGNEDLIASVPRLWKALFLRSLHAGGHYCFANHGVKVEHECLHSLRKGQP